MKPLIKITGMLLLTIALMSVFIMSHEAMHGNVCNDIEGKHHYELTLWAAQTHCTWNNMNGETWKNEYWREKSFWIDNLGYHLGPFYGLMVIWLVIYIMKKED